MTSSGPSVFATMARCDLFIAPNLLRIGAAIVTEVLFSKAEIAVWRDNQVVENSHLNRLQHRNQGSRENFVMLARVPEF